MANLIGSIHHQTNVMKSRPKNYNKKFKLKKNCFFFLLLAAVDVNKMSFLPHHDDDDDDDCCL